jgi:hypothetical protein
MMKEDKHSYELLWVRHKIKIRYETYKKFEGFSMQKIIVIDVIIQLTELLQWVCLTKMLSVRIAKSRKDDPTMNLRETQNWRSKKGNYNYRYI